jgi:hypothetical protein
MKWVIGITGEQRRRCPSSPPRLSPPRMLPSLEESNPYRNADELLVLAPTTKAPIVYIHRLPTTIRSTVPELTGSSKSLTSLPLRQTLRAKILRFRQDLELWTTQTAKAITPIIFSNLIIPKRGRYRLQLLSALLVARL